MDTQNNQTPRSSTTPLDMGTTETVTFAGGCFWCLQPSFDSEPGVIKSLV
jgi:hypothetical protein